jgi:arylsulfatase A-like enzyme
MHMTDIFPTFLAATGIQPDPGWKVDGHNMLGVWQGKEKAPPRTLFWEWRVEKYYQLAAMRGDLKLVITGTNPPELFNVVTDPGERRNILAEYPVLAEEMRRQLAAWLQTESAESKWGKTPSP